MSFDATHAPCVAQEAEETQRREEVKRLKNLKRQQIESRLAAIQEVAGRPTADAEAMDGELLDQLLQGDFDPAQYDELMARAFGQDYYEAEVGGLIGKHWRCSGCNWHLMMRMHTRCASVGSV